MTAHTAESIEKSAHRARRTFAHKGLEVTTWIMGYETLYRMLRDLRHLVSQNSRGAYTFRGVLVVVSSDVSRHHFAGVSDGTPR